jgi:hypothetical protein
MNEESDGLELIFACLVVGAMIGLMFCLELPHGTHG